MSDHAALIKLAHEVHRQRGEPPGYDGPCWGPTQDDLDEAAARLAGCNAYTTGFCGCGHLAAIAARAEETARYQGPGWSAADRNRPPIKRNGGVSSA